jgi:endoglucanase
MSSEMIVRKVKYNDLVYIKDYTSNEYLCVNSAGRCVFKHGTETAFQFLIRPKNGDYDANDENELVTQKAFHLECKGWDRFLANDNKHAVIGEDMYVVVYNFSESVVVEYERECGVSIGDSMLYNDQDQNAKFPGVTGSVLSFEFIQHDQPLVSMEFVNKRIQKGINYANVLEAPKGQDWGGGTIEEKYMAIIKTAGFNCVRLPVRWDDRCDSNGEITQERLKEVEVACQYALMNDLIVILNVHHFDGLMDNPEANTEQYLNIISQIGNYFKHFPSTVLFELCNEPHKQLNNVWNDVLAQALPVFRKHNRTRTCIIGPAGYNSRQWLDKLVIPSSARRYIITVHFYEPMNFTHFMCPYQDVSGPTGYKSHWGQKLSDYQELYAKFTEIKQVVKARFGVPVNIGEFGTFAGALTYGSRKDHQIGVSDMRSRENWTRMVAQACYAHGFSYCVFDFCSVWAMQHMGFGLYDQSKDNWVGGIKDALFL